MEGLPIYADPDDVNNVFVGDMDSCESTNLEMVPEIQQCDSGIQMCNSEQSKTEQNCCESDIQVINIR